MNVKQALIVEIQHILEIKKQKKFDKVRVIEF